MLPYDHTTVISSNSLLLLLQEFRVFSDPDAFNGFKFWPAATMLRNAVAGHCDVGRCKIWLWLTFRYLYPNWLDTVDLSRGHSRFIRIACFKPQKVLFRPVCDWASREKIRPKGVCCVARRLAAHTQLARSWRADPEPAYKGLGLRGWGDPTFDQPMAPS